MSIEKFYKPHTHRYIMIEKKEIRVELSLDEYERLINYKKSQDNSSWRKMLLSLIPKKPNE